MERIKRTLGFEQFKDPEFTEQEYFNKWIYGELKSLRANQNWLIRGFWFLLALLITHLTGVTP